MQGELSEAVARFSTWILPLVLGITLHEAAHGYVALRFGDDTALRMGRISINPLRHVDPVGTIILPGLLLLTGAGMLFGWAKPVPVNFRNLHPARIGMAVVAAAGPLTNVVLAIVSAVLLFAVQLLPAGGQEWAVDNLENSVLFNLVLAFFNMIPLPPLDGGRVAVGLLPWRFALPLANAERYTLPLLMAALFLLPMIHLNVFGWLVGGPALYFDELIHHVLGLE